MTNKKSGFWTFICSLIPGAGEMYMGFFKQGLSLMLLTFLVIVVGSFFGMGFLGMLLPIIWLYSFFHVHHLRGLPPEEFYMVEDRFLFLENIDGCKQNWNIGTKKVIAVILLVLGGVMLWNIVWDSLIWILPSFFDDWVWRIRSTIPRILIGIGVIYLGVKMLKGNPIKKEIIEHKEEE